MTYSRPTPHPVARDGRLERRYELCPACGKYQKDPWQYVCLNCEQRSDDKQAGSAKAKVPHLTLVSSPDPTWTVGGLWFMHELKQTVADGNMTPGTVFRGSGTGRVYVVTEDMRLCPTGDL
jgi:hypothetical protein